MIIRAYSVYDRKALTYNPPFHAPTDGAAIRIVADAANDQNTSLGRHPNDYVLFFVGTYDDQTGAMAPAAPLVHVIDLNALLDKQQPLPFAQATDI